MERNVARRAVFTDLLSSVLTIIWLLLRAASSHSSDPTLAFPAWWLGEPDGTVHLLDEPSTGLIMDRAADSLRSHFATARPIDRSGAGDSPELHSWELMESKS
jgi:hypothetical protein